MGSGGVAIAALPTVICLKVPFSDGLGGVNLLFIDSSKSKDACCRNRRHTNVKTPKTRAQTAGLRVTNRLFATGYM